MAESEAVTLNAAQSATVAASYLDGLDPESIRSMTFISSGERLADGTFETIEFILDTAEHRSHDLIGPTGSVSSVGFTDKLAERLSRVSGNTIVGKDGVRWYRLLAMAPGTPPEDAEPGISWLKLHVEYPDGGVADRTVPDQDVERFADWK